MRLEDGQDHDLLALRLEIEHLDAIEGLALRADRAILSMRAVSSASRDRWQSQVDARFGALALDPERAEREARFRLQSLHFSEARTAAWVLGVLNSPACWDAAGRVVMKARCAGAVFDGLSRAPAAPHASIDDPASVELAALRGPVPDGYLLALFGSTDAHPGLVVAGCANRLPSWSLPLLQRHAFGGHDLAQALALFALGRDAARRGPSTHVAWAAAVDVALGDRLFDNHCALLAMSVVGAHPTSRRIADRLRRGAVETTLLTALGRLGVVREVPLLVDFLASRCEDGVTRGALRALFMATGQLFALPPMRDDGVGLQRDIARAEAFCSGLSPSQALDRMHLGLRMRPEVESDVGSVRALRDTLFGHGADLLKQFVGRVRGRQSRTSGLGFFDLLGDLRDFVS